MNNLLLKLHLTVRSFLRSEEGQDLTEYGLIVCLIAMVCITGINDVATSIKTVFSNIDKALF